MHPVQTGSRTITYAKYSDAWQRLAKIYSIIDGSNSSKAHFRVLTLIELNALSYMRQC
jgi:hypothetical protein